MRLGDLDALQRRVCGAKCGCEHEDCGSEHDCDFDFFIFNTPTIDPVHKAGGCYCHECQFSKKTIGWYYWCTHNGEYKIPDDFCSRGVVRVEECEK